MHRGGREKGGRVNETTPRTRFRQSPCQAFPQLQPMFMQRPGKVRTEGAGGNQRKVGDHAVPRHARPDAAEKGKKERRERVFSCAFLLSLQKPSLYPPPPVGAADFRTEERKKEPSLADPSLFPSSVSFAEIAGPDKRKKDKGRRVFASPPCQPLRISSWFNLARIT